MAFTIDNRAPAPPVDEVFWTAFEGDHYEPRSDSGFGNSWHSVLYQCARKYYFMNVQGLRPGTFGEGDISEDSSYALVRGTLLHGCEEIWYTGGRFGKNFSMSKEAEWEAFERLDKVGRHPVYAKVVEDSERAFRQYLEFYRDVDRQELEVLGAEVPMHAWLEVPGHEPLLYTIRADILIRHKPTGLNWIFESKHHGSWGAQDRTQYLLNLQVQGEYWTFLRNWPQAPFGGVVVNVMVCTKKSPSFHRIAVVPSPQRLAMFEKSIVSYHRLKQHFAVEDWPQNFTACGQKFPGSKGGLCDYHTLCLANFTTADVSDPNWTPPGFVRRERLVRKEAFG